MSCLVNSKCILLTFFNEVTRELIVSSSGKFDQTYASLQKLYGGHQVVLKQKHYYYFYRVSHYKKLESENRVSFWVQYRTPCIYFYILIWSESKDEMACALQHYIAVGLFQPFFFLLALLVIENRIAWCDWWHSLAQRAFWKLINFSTHSVLLCPHLWPWKIFTIHKSTPCFTFLFKSVTTGSCTDCLKSKVALLYFHTTL